MADITFTITDLAREFGLTTRAIRFYEVYTNRDRVRLKLTLRGKRLGLSLSEIRELLDMYDAAKGGRGQIERFLEVLQKRRSALEQQREDIEAVLGEISSFEQQCHELLQKKRAASSKKRTGNRDPEIAI
jgi:DNA-binding transcriptional MerR regulator